MSEFSVGMFAAYAVMVLVLVYATVKFNRLYRDEMTRIHHNYQDEVSKILTDHRAEMDRIRHDHQIEMARIEHGFEEDLEKIHQDRRDRRADH